MGVEEERAYQVEATACAKALWLEKQKRTAWLVHREQA